MSNDRALNISRCDRFIAEFNVDFVKKYELVGHFVQKQGLEVHYEKVYYSVTIKDAFGNEQYLIRPFDVYDPTGSYEENFDKLCRRLIDSKARDYNLQREQLAKRFQCVR